MDKQIKSYCQRCDFETNHEILFKEDFRSAADDYDYALYFMVLKCSGCETISFRREFINIESAYPDENGVWKPDITVNTYPNKSKVKIGFENVYDLPEKIRLIYIEAINAYNAECPILTGVAFRAVIEAICIEEGITGRNLEIKINNLVRQKLITEKESKRLHSIRFIGNDSVHEMIVPKERSLRLVLNIIEHLLSNIYLIDHDGKGVLETVIDDFVDFEDLLYRCVRKINNEDEVPLAKILGKNVRRFNGKLTDFEAKLIEKIKNNEYSLLKIGKIDRFGNDTIERQHFVINKNR